MNSTIKTKVLGISHHMSENRISSEQLDSRLGGKIGRIQKNSGVAFRHHCTNKETVCDMGAEALKKALKKASVQAKDLDLLIFCGATYDYPIPHNAVKIKALICDDSATFNCFDVDSTCLSFLSALEIAQLYLETGRHKKIALVCSEIASRALHPDNEKVYGLFGDAAVAVILSTGNEGLSMSATHFKNYVSGAHLAGIALGGVANRGLNENSDHPGFYFNMDGKALMKLTMKHLKPFVSEVEKINNIKIDQYDKIITHQASKFGNNYIRSAFGLKDHQLCETLENYGNCIAASIPLGWSILQEEGYDFNGKKILLLGSGAGLTFGAIALEFD